MKGNSKQGPRNSMDWERGTREKGELTARHAQ